MANTRRNGRPPDVELFHYAKTHDEIAKVLKVSRQAVQQLEHRAIEKLRQSGLLEEWHEVLRKKLAA